LVYESELVKPDPTGKRKHGVLNEARIRELAKQSRREGYRTISTDIESWFAEKDGQLLTPDELRTDLSTPCLRLPVGSGLTSSLS
jgi:hypothetical protein